MSVTLGRHPHAFRFVAILLLMWITGDMVGTGVCPASIDPCCNHDLGSPEHAGLPHGTHDGMMLLHQGHCLAHGLVTMGDSLPLVAEPVFLCDVPDSVAAGMPRDPSHAIDHPPQLAAR